jgi:hypothetical protein
VGDLLLAKWVYHHYYLGLIMAKYEGKESKDVLFGIKFLEGPHNKEEIYWVNRWDIKRLKKQKGE